MNADDPVAAAATTELPVFATRHPNLASASLGAAVLSCTDEFFAPAQRMLQDTSPVFVAGRFDDHGKWMDGWETRRRRGGGNDHAIIRLGLPGMIHGLDIDTSHFTGNFPPAASVHVAHCESEPDAHTEWIELVAACSLQGNAHHFVKVDDARTWTHLRLDIFPDGGVARLRVYGHPVRDWEHCDRSILYEASALANGGRIVAFNDAHYGPPLVLLTAGRGVNMGDGWETRRRREPGNDWIIIELGHPVAVAKIEVDTAHFKGNYPDRVSVQGARVGESTDQSLVTQAMFWPEILGAQKISMDRQHFYEGADILFRDPVSHVRVNMFPDGGISRVRIWGYLAP